MRILFAAPENAWGGMLAKLRTAHPELEFVASGDFRIATLQGFDVLIPTMSEVSSQVLQSADRLQLIQQMGAGLEGVDMSAARERGIAVCNVPTDVSGNADSVAELGIYLMLGLARNARVIGQHLQEGRLGRPMGLSLKGKTVGLVGLGGIGKALAVRLAGFGTRLIGVKRQPDTGLAQQLGLDWVAGMDDLPELLAEADFVVFSLPDNEATHGLINERTVELFKPGAFLINLGRGGLVERDVLHQALSSGRLAGAGLDVFWQEPPDASDPIFDCNLLATPHIGGVTDISLEGIYQGVSENLRRLQSGQSLLYRQDLNPT